MKILRVRIPAAHNPVFTKYFCTNYADHYRAAFGLTNRPTFDAATNEITFNLDNECLRIELALLRHYENYKKRAQDNQYHCTLLEL